MAAKVRVGGNTWRHRLDRAELWNRLAGHPHTRDQRWQWLSHQWHEDLDLQRHPWPHFRSADKTDPEAKPRHRGITLFLVEKGDGFKHGRKLEKLGYKGIDSAELMFEDCYVPTENIIGGIEGEGFKQIMGGLELGRINVAARGVGVAQASLDEAVKYAQQRQTFGKPIAEHQAIQLNVADMVTRTEAARLLTYRAAESYDKGERCDMEAGMAKLFATEAALTNSMDSMRVHGGYGYSKEFAVERFYRDAPLLTIGEGTNELQRIIIARQLFARNPV